MMRTLESLKASCREALLPVTRLFERLHPNALTLIGFIITVGASFWYSRGIFWIGGLILLVSGLFDVIDGEVAKLTGRVTKFGAFWDSCLDRYSDFVILLGILYWYLKVREPVAPILALLTILGSYMVSYTRARAEGLGIECRVGLGERAFRVTIIVVGSFFGQRIFVGFLWLLAILTNGTAFYRMYHVYKGGKNG